MEKQPGSLFAAIWKLMNKPKPKQGHIKDKTGKVLTETNDILDRWRRYCKDLYATKCQAYTEWLNEERSCCQEPEIMVSEVEKAIGKLNKTRSHVVYDTAERRCFCSSLKV